MSVLVLKFGERVVLFLSVLLKVLFEQTGATHDRFIQKPVKHLGWSFSQK